MDVRYSAEQAALRDSAAQVVDRLGPSTVGALHDRERASKLDAAVASSGWRELRTPTEDGTPWASGVEVAVVAEELGRGLADAAFLGPTLAAEWRRLAGAPAAVTRETVALAPGLARSAALAGKALGHGSVAVDAQDAACALVLTEERDHMRLAAVPVVRPRSSDRSGVDLTRPMAGWDVTPAPEDVLGQERPLTPDAVARWRSLGLAVACADLVGVMRGALDLTCDYSRARKQYGASIGSFQAVQHLLADALVAMEGSRSVALHAAWAVDALPSAEALTAASVAKAYCGRAARTVCETAIQVHGGIGNTWDCLAHVYLRRALLSTELLGGVGESVTLVLEAYGVGGGDGFR
jgi:alkylation response protein AidB-like acyl-CoA dehydrogenase